MKDIYTSAIFTFIEQIKADKTIVQPWRNKAVARLEEVSAFVRMGKTTTYLSPVSATEHSPESFAGSKMVDNALPDNGFPDPNVAKCNCPAFGKRRTCPIHGDQS